MRRVAPGSRGGDAQNAAVDARTQTAIRRNAFKWWAVSIGIESYREDDSWSKRGEPAPTSSVKSDGGESVKLSDSRGKQVVLYFYPKDDTPGCTTQACGIRDVYGEFQRDGAVVLGISPDDERRT